MQQQQTPGGNKLDTALHCLVAAVKLIGLPVELEQLRRAYVFDERGMDTTTLIRAAKDIGLKASLATPEIEDIRRWPLPAIAILKNGNYAVILQTDGEKVAIFDPTQPQSFSVPLSTFRNAWSGTLVFLARRHSVKSKQSKFGFAWFFPIILQYKRFFAEVLGLSLLLQLLGIISPMFTQVIIDKVLVHRSTSTLNVFILGMTIVSLFQIWFTSLRGYLFTHTTNKIDVILSAKLFRHITNLPMKYFESWEVGQIVSRVREIDTIHRFITGSALTVVLDFVFAIVYILVMFIYSSTLSLVVLAILPAFVILTLIVSPIFKKLLNEQFRINSENQSFLIEAITGIQTVKSLAVERLLIQKWEDMLARYVKIAMSTINLANIAGNLGSFLQHFFNLAILWVGAHAVLDGKISVGELIAFQMLAGQVIAPILRLIGMWQQMQQVLVSVNRVGDILNEAAEPAFNPNRTTLPKVSGEVVFDRTTFRYRPDMSEVLHQISLHIPAGTKVGIVGRSGSGKSTLTKLVQRLYIPESGRVMIDGVDLAQVEPAWLRRQIGVVLQESYLFSGTIRENIAIASPNATDEEIIRAATTAGAHDFIVDLAKGYDTPVGERGAALSGGQRQRIAIARALITDPSILIFDEATSALDYESERIIMQNLNQMAEGRTMLIIAHRLSTVRKADIIIVLDKGKIIESGTHQVLMANRGYYYYLHSQQEYIGIQHANQHVLQGEVNLG